MALCDDTAKPWAVGGSEKSQMHHSRCVSRMVSIGQVMGGTLPVARTRRRHTGVGLRLICATLLWLKMIGAVGHVWEGLGGLGGFDATRGFPGEGPEGREGQRSAGGKDRDREARGFLKTGTTNVTSWKSFMDDFAHR